jgi:hypothetical protein
MSHLTEKISFIFAVVFFCIGRHRWIFLTIAKRWWPLLDPYQNSYFLLGYKPSSNFFDHPKKMTIIIRVSTLQKFINVFLLGHKSSSIFLTIIKNDDHMDIALWVSVQNFRPLKKWQSFLEFAPNKHSNCFLLGYE